MKINHVINKGETVGMYQRKPDKREMQKVISVNGK